MSEISVGGKVRLIAIPPYLKTADPMPMLRPPELLNIDDIGTVIDRRPGGYWG
ncbi:MAG: NAD(P)H dehydrogenase assembly family protein, partial [Microcystis panniformis]